MTQPASSAFIIGRIPKLPPKYAMVVMPLLMSGLMSGIISMVNLIRALGWSQQVLQAWPSTWLVAWSIAFPTVMVVIPLVRRLTAKLVRVS